MVDGKLMRVHPEGDYVSDYLAAHGTYFEEAILQRLTDYVHGGALVDVGAMLGNHSLYLARYLPHEFVYAFEPVPANYALLEWNVALREDIITWNVALSDRPGTLAMAYSQRNMGHSVVVDTDPWPEADMVPVEVAARTLDSLKIQDVGLLKIDVEWHEPQVLAGARQTILRDRPPILIEDWARAYEPLLGELGYRRVKPWPDEHQTFLYTAR